MPSTIHDSPIPTAADGIPFVRPDPKKSALPGQELVNSGIQSLWGALAQRRFRTAFNDVTTFALFVGYPRSGHSVVGAMLNAHREAVIAHELDAPRLIVEGCARDALYSRILARAAWFNLRGNASNYRYQIPNRWQGRFETLRVIGEKSGGWMAQWIRRYPDILERIRETVRVPVRLIHVVRNPYDNIAAISLWHHLSLDDSIEFYFSHCETTGTLGAIATPAEAITVRHEDFIDAPAAALSQICDFLGLQADPEYLDSCGSIVFGRPTHSRRRVEWTSAQVLDVQQRIQRYPSLGGYEFELTETTADARAKYSTLATTRVVSAREWSPSFADRLGAFLQPRVTGPLHSPPRP